MVKQFVFAAISLCVAAASGRAAEVVSEADTLSITLEDIEVTATRATGSTPVAFTNVTAADIANRNDGRDVPYLLSLTPSVITTSDAGNGIGYTSIRVRGTDASRINVTANGVPVNNPESHGVYWVDLPDVVSSVRNIQIQRGAGTSTNGAGAFGASINMATVAPTAAPYAEFSGSYGMYNTHKESIGAGTGRIGNHWNADIRLSNIGTDGYIDRASVDLWSYFAQVGYTGGDTSVKLLAFGGKEISYLAWDYASKEDMEKYGRRYNPAGAYTDSNGNQAYYPNQKDNYILHNFQLLFNQSIGNGWNLNATLFYTKGDGFYEQFKSDASLLEYGLNPFVDPATGQVVSESDLVRIKSMDNGFGGIVASLNYAHQRVNATFGGSVNNYRGHHFGQVQWIRNFHGATDPLKEYYRNKGEKFDANVYARANVNLGRGLSAYGDLQYRHINYTIKGIHDTYDYATNAMVDLDIHERYNFFNPKVGINWQPNISHRLFASWSVAHREPTRDNFVDSDMQLRPVAERLFDYEAGYSFSSGFFSAEANFYYMDYKNQLVVTGQLSDTGTPISVNVPSSYRIGIELQAAFRPCNWFEWDANATLSGNRIKNFVEYIYEDGWKNPITFNRGNTPIAFSPGFIFHTALNFNYRGFDASLTGQYVGKQYMTNSRNEDLTLDPYFVSDLHLGYTLPRIPGIKELRIGFTIYNLFNETYENNGYAGSGYYVRERDEKVIYNYAGYSAQAPTNVMGTICLKF